MTGQLKGKTNYYDIKKTTCPFYYCSSPRTTGVSDIEHCLKPFYKHGVWVKQPRESGSDVGVCRVLRSGQRPQFLQPGKLPSSGAVCALRPPQHVTAAHLRAVLLSTRHCPALQPSRTPLLRTHLRYRPTSAFSEGRE